MEVLRTMVLAGLQVRRGTIERIEADGKIIIKGDLESILDCDFLRTSSGPLPLLSPGDAVLYAYDEVGSGYVLGLIQKYVPETGRVTGTSTTDCTLEKREIKLVAGERIELRCGNGSVIIRKDGKIILRGEEVVSRARGVNKIKGAAVQIN